MNTSEGNGLLHSNGISSFDDGLNSLGIKRVGTTEYLGVDQMELNRVRAINGVVKEKIILIEDYPMRTEITTKLPRVSSSFTSCS